MSNDSSESTTIAKQGAITLFGNQLSRVAGFVFLLIVTRLVAPSTYGVFVLGLSIVSFASRLFGLSIHQSVDFFVPDFLNKNESGKAKSVLVNSFVIGTIGGILGITAVLLGTEEISKILDEPALVQVLPIFSIYILLDIYDRILLNSFSSIKRLKYRVYMKDIIRPAFRVTVTVILLLFGFSVVGLVLGHILALSVSILFGIYFFMNGYVEIIKTEIEFVSRRALMSYSLPLVFSGLIFSLVGQIDYFVIGYYATSGNVGKYRIAYQLAGYLMIALAALTPIIKPLISEAKGDTRSVKARYRLATRWIVMITLPMSATLALAPRTYLSVLFTPEYATAGSSVVMLAAGYVINASVGTEGKVLQGLGRTRITLLNSLLLLTTNVALDLFLVPRIGILGAAVGTATASSVAGVAGVLEIYYFEKIHPFSRSLFKIMTSIVPSIAIGGVFVLVMNNEAIIAVLLPIIITITYIISLVLFSSFVDEDVKVASLIDEKIGYSVLAPIVSFELGRLR